MNSVSRPGTVRVYQDSLVEHVSAYRMALELFGTVDLGSFLPEPQHAKYLEVLVELVSLEMAHLWKQETPVTVDAYRARFPELFENAPLVNRLMQEERSRQQANDNCPTSRRLHPRASTSECVDALLCGPGTPKSRLESPGKTRVASVPTTEGKVPVMQPSEPEIILAMNQAMTCIPEVGGEFAGFHLIRELGKGAFGKVYLAQQGQLAGRQVALKVASDLFVESQTLAQLQHTHIVPIYSFHPGQPFQAVCMPYLGSTTLAHILEDIRLRKSLPGSGKGLLSTLNDRKRKSTNRFEDPSSTPSNPGSAPAGCHAGDTPALEGIRSALLEVEGLSYVDAILWLAIRLADGLAHAHERGVIHRDLKPANILLTDDGLPMLLDFNLAQNTSLRGSAAAASVGGTLPYMAPEHLGAFQGQGVAVDARSDLYSLGVILFELLTGVTPFPTYRKLPIKETVDRMIQDRRCEVPRLRSLNSAVPHAVESILIKCLQANPDSRYQTCRQLQEDLQRQLENRPLKYAANKSVVERAAKLRRRYPRLTPTMVAGLFLAVLCGLGYWHVEREKRHVVLEAREKLTQFQDDANESFFLLNAFTARERLHEGENAARAALQPFEVLENADWANGPLVKRLPPDEQRRLKGDVGGVLLLLAQAEQLAASVEENSDRRAARCRTGLQFCSLAETCFDSDQIPQALWGQRAVFHEQLNEREQARDSSERARKAEPKSAQDLFLAAQGLVKDKKFSEALALLNQAMRANPREFHVHFLKGVCHDQLAQNTDSVACYQACVALRPQFFGSYYNRGLAHLREHKFALAKADFDEALRLRPDFLESYLNRSLAWDGMGDKARAEKDLTDVIERGFYQTRAYFMRAKLRQKTGNPDGADRDLAEGLRMEPADEQSWVARGIALLKVDPAQALRDFDKALASNPYSLPALQNKTHVLAKHLKRPEQAIATLDQAIKIYPDDACLRASRGVYLARTGKRAAAHLDAAHALNVDRNASTLYHVAGIYALTSAEEPSDAQEALRLLASALKHGFGFEYLEQDRDLDPLRRDPQFRRVMVAAQAFRR